MSCLTKSRIKHVERHAIALFRARDCDQPFVTIVLWFVNLNHTATDLAYLVNLLSSLANDGADHVIGNVDLLSDGCSWDGTAHGLRLGSPAMRLRASMGRHVRLNVRCCSIGTSLLTILHGNRRIRLSGMMGVLLRIGRGGQVMSPAIVVSSVVLASAVMSRGRLWTVGDDLHATRNRTGWGTTSGGIG